MSKLMTHMSSTVALSSKSKKWIKLAEVVAQKLLPTKVAAFHLNIVICGDLRMRALNLNHRNKDKVTDVLSFPAQENIRGGKRIDLIAPGEASLGDMVICLPQARRQSQKFHVSLDEELVHLFFHGFLHLLGYDHELSAKEELLMSKLESQLLESFSRLRKQKFS
jgi:probable rRNA maturation factor